MSRLWAATVWCGIFVSLSVQRPTPAQAGPPDRATLDITVRLYDYADVPPHYLEKTQSEAARILREAGISTRWVDCPPAAVSTVGLALPSPEARQYAECGRQLLPSNLVLRILPESMVPSWARGTALFGYALPGPQDGFGAVANVFFHRVEELRREIQTLPVLRIFSPGVILGHLMAHELGHLLLGGNSHAPAGIMQFPMGRDQLLAMPKGYLFFTKRQSQRIRQNVRRRMEAAKTNGALRVE